MGRTANNNNTLKICKICNCEGKCVLFVTNRKICKKCQKIKYKKYYNDNKSKFKTYYETSKKKIKK